MNIAERMDDHLADVTIIGGGIVGLATALALAERFPGRRLAVLEKERDLAVHQTGHNSGVVHSGIYYRPGSHKARLCTEGVRLMEAFCAEHNVRIERCGKVIVATEERELPRLDELLARGAANGVPGLRRIGPEALHEIEPHAAGLGAVHLPATAIVDYRAVALAMAREAARRGAAITTAAEVSRITSTSEGLHLQGGAHEARTRHLINCAGLHADTIARLAGVRPEAQIIPFRGEYYTVRPERGHLVRGLIYPVPDLRFPFLGVHFTRTVHGEVEAGPNAVLAFAREGYQMNRVSLRDLGEIVAYRGFWAMARRYWRAGLGEFVRSLSKGAFVRALQRLMPALEEADVTRNGAGVRAQAVGRDGRLLDDFHIIRAERAIHVLNAPSPAATASLAIGRHIAGLAAEAFDL